MSLWRFFGRRHPAKPSPRAVLVTLTRDLTNQALPGWLEEMDEHLCVRIIIPSGHYKGDLLYLPIQSGVIVTATPLDRSTGSFLY